MSTKKSPGKYDCYAAAQDDEPIFVLLGRDPFVAQLIRLWAYATLASGADIDKAESALFIAAECETWCQLEGRKPAPVLPLNMDEILRRALQCRAQLITEEHAAFAKTPKAL